MGTKGPGAMIRYLTTILLLFGVLGAAYASGDQRFVYTLDELQFAEGETLDQAFAIARQTAGIEESEYRVIVIPLNAQFQPMVEIPESPVFTAIQDSLSRAQRADGNGFEDGDLSVEFAVTDESYVVAVRFNVDVQIDEVVFLQGTLLTYSQNTNSFHWLMPVVIGEPVVILQVTEDILDRIEDDIPREGRPQDGEFILAHVTVINSGERYRIISIALQTTAFVWMGQVENREPEELNPFEGEQSENRSPNTPVPVTYNVRQLALMSMEQRVEAWLDGDIEITEDNCFVLSGSCYRHGYLGNSYSEGVFQVSYGIMLGTVVVGNEYVVMIGYQTESDDRIVIPFNAGSTDQYMNGLGVVYIDVPTIGASGSQTVVWPHSQGLEYASFLNQYIGSPTLVALITGEINVTAEYLDYRNWLSGQYDEAIELNDFIYGFSVEQKSPYLNSPSYMNTIPSSTDGLAAVGSISFSRFV